MERPYSTLELAKFDETISAPERDYNATAFELDTGALAPQVVPDGTPEVFYNNSLPEAQSNEESTKERVPSLPFTKIALKWPWIVTALFVAAAIAVGVAIGIWRHREHSSHESVPASNKSSPNISLPVSHNGSITPTTQFLLNDTSLAALSDSNGNRYLFFQDPTGLIRGVVRTDSEWSTSLNLGTSINAKYYTPLAALAANYSYTGYGIQAITLFYVSERHFLNSSTYSSNSWSPETSPGALSRGDFSTAVNTRSLSVAQTAIVLPDETSTQRDLTLLYYENPAGKVSALSQETIVDSQSTEWVDITSQQSKSLPERYRNTPGSTTGTYSKTLDETVDSNTFTLSAPFTCEGILSDGPYYIEAIFYSTDASNSEILTNGYVTGPSGAGNFSPAFPFSTQDPSSNQAYSAVHQSDFALYGEFFLIWINHTNPVVDGLGRSLPPENVFPFTRLASITLADSSFSYLYHQINGTTFAEEQYDITVGSWIATEYITISYS